MKVIYKGRKIEIEDNTTLEKVLRDKSLAKDYKYLVTSALVDNKLRELTYPLSDGVTIEFLDLQDRDSRHIYMRSLIYVFLAALNNVDKNAVCRMEHSLSNGIYCDISNSSTTVNSKYRKKVKEEMQRIIDEDIPITREEVSTEDAIKVYEEKVDKEKAKLFKYRESEKSIVYQMGEFKDYFYGFMLPSTGYLELFDVILYSGNLVVLGPDVKEPDKVSEFKNEPRLFTIYTEAKDWSKIIEIPSVAYLNKAIENGEYPELIRCSEAYHEKKICDIADIICRDRKKRIILIAGPSSSGKTSFAQRLKLQLMVNKRKPISISVDNYFINRDNTPRDEYGRYDFETIEAIDLEKFNDDLERLILGYETRLPIYNFVKGEREPIENSLPIKISEDQPIIIEGIHCLNPVLTEAISFSYKFKIYISCLTQLNLDGHNRISTTDSRLIRRIIRDNTHRGNSAEETLAMWDSVNEGERKNIFIFQESADIMFNSALIYEIAVLKKYIYPLLKNIDEDNEFYREARRLLKFLQYFKSLQDESDIPNTSIIREFIGGSKLVD